MDSEDGWIVVTKGPKSEKADKMTKINSNVNPTKKVSLNHSLKEKQILYDLEKSDVKKVLSNMIADFLISREAKKLGIRTLGVGSVNSNINGFFQTMLIYIIQENLKKQYSKNLSSYINDPVFTKEDVEFLKIHDMQRLEDDVKIMSANENETTVFYMPHCEQELYLKVLELNEKKLSKLCIIGNSLIGYLKKAEMAGKSKSDEYLKLKKFIELKNYEERKIPVFENRYEAFNDTFFIKFV